MWNSSKNKWDADRLRWGTGASELNWNGDYFDNTRWEPLAVGQGEWVTDHWESQTPSWEVVNIIPLGVWNIGFRPTKIRVNANGTMWPPDLVIGLRFGPGPFQDHGETITENLQVWDIDPAWFDDGDIYKFILTDFTSTSTFNITAIEFVL